MKNRRQPVLADVARRASVSSQTVSRVLREPSTVAPDTRSRVLAAIKELDYRPNMAARSLATNRTGSIQVLLDAPPYHGLAETFLAVTDAARAEGYYVSIATTAGADLGSRAQVPPLHVDALVVLGAYDSAVTIATSYADDLPVVLVLAAQSGLRGVSTVSIDQRAGATLATEHLMACGATDLVHVTGSLDWIDARERLIGFQASCASHGIEPRHVESRTWDAAEGYAIGRELVESRNGGTLGVFAANDHLGLGVCRACHEQGVRIPAEVAVVGFDNTSGSDCFYPPLTTITQDFAGLGRAAIEAMKRRIAGALPTDTVLVPTLVVRESTAAR